MLHEVAPTGSSADWAKNLLRMFSGNVMINGGKFTTINTEEKVGNDLDIVQ